MKDLRHEQENFLQLYKFASRLVAKVLHLRELRTPPPLSEFIQQHFGLVD